MVYIGQENDNESWLADHGVRKYDYETGRFMSVDPLWSEYLGLTPYHYSSNDPVNRLDPSGFADFIFSSEGDSQIGGRVLNDGNDDGLLFASTETHIGFSLVNNLEEGQEGPLNLDYELLKSNSWQMPKFNVRGDILSYHVSRVKGSEGGSVFTLNEFFWGGFSTQTESGGGIMGTATTQVKQALYDAVGYLNCLIGYGHDHPYEAGLRPTPGDREFLGKSEVNWFGRPTLNYNRLQYGILIHDDNVVIFGWQDGHENRVVTDKGTFMNYGD
jgi:RHS repeat-associated protein